MRKTLIAAVVAMVVLWIDVAAAGPDVTSVWNTNEAVRAFFSQFDNVWSPRESQLVATAVFDESNRYQYTQVSVTRQGWGAVNRTGQGYIYFYRAMSCRICDAGVLRVSEAGADLAATTLDPTSPDCQNSGWRIDCDDQGNCTYNEDYGFEGARIVQGHWAQPELTRSATSTVQEVNYFPLRRSNQICRTFDGRMLSGSFWIGAIFFDHLDESQISRTNRRATQQQNP